MTYEILSERRAPDYRISSPSDAFEVFKRYANSRVEKFAVAVLNSAHHVIAVKLISIGTVNRAIAAPREVFYPAILLNGVAIIAMHTHPSNCTNPSDDDIALTRRLRDAGAILGIPLLDHLILGRKGSRFSLLEHGLIPPQDYDS